MLCVINLGVHTVKTFASDTISHKDHHPGGDKRAEGAVLCFDTVLNGRPDIVPVIDGSAALAVKRSLQVLLNVVRSHDRFAPFVKNVARQKFGSIATGDLFDPLALSLKKWLDKGQKPTGTFMA